MNYAPHYHPQHAAVATIKFRIGCPCCHETLEIAFPEDPIVSVVESVPLRTRGFDRDRGGQVPLTVAARDLDEETLKTALAQGWKLPEIGAPAWLQYAATATIGATKEVRLMLVMIGTLVALLVVLGTYTMLQHTKHVSNETGSNESEAGSLKRSASLLADEAKGTLRRFLAANTCEEKLALVVNPNKLAGTMIAYYQANGLEKGLRVEEFSACPELVSESDTRRGVTCLMRTPGAEFSFSENPVASLDPTQTLQGAPALYFFRNGKLDWETFTQHYQKSLQNFLKMPSPRAGVFRVVLQRTEAPGDAGTVLISDVCVIPQQLDQVALTTLSPAVAASLQELPPGKCRLATVELMWTERAIPTLTIKGIVCWESQGVGETLP